MARIGVGCKKIQNGLGEDLGHIGHRCQADKSMLRALSFGKSSAWYSLELPMVREHPFGKLRTFRFAGTSASQLRFHGISKVYWVRLAFRE